MGSPFFVGFKYQPTTMCLMLHTPNLKTIGCDINHECFILMIKANGVVTIHLSIQFLVGTIAHIAQAF